MTLERGGELGSLKTEHFLTEEDAPVRDTWEELELAVEQGLTKGIGVSNFSPKKIDQILQSAKIPPAINQVERHPLLQLPKLTSFCREQGIHVTAYSPLGSTDRPSDLKKENEPVLLEMEEIVAIAKKHSVTPAQVLLRWNIQDGWSTIPKSTNPERIRENLHVINIQLDEEDMKMLGRLNRDYRFLDGSFWCTDGSPYTLETLWDGP